MKALKISTKEKFDVITIGEKVTLKNKLGKITRISPESFKKDFQLVEEGKNPYDKGTEIKEAKEKAQKVLKDIETKRSRTVRLNFTETKKPKTVAAEKEVVKEARVKAPNTVTLKEICDEINMNPAKARRILRKKLSSNDHSRWEWSDPKQIKEIKSLLKE